MERPPIKQVLPPIAILLAKGVCCGVKALRELCFSAVEGAGPGVVKLLRFQLETEVLTAQQRKWVKRALSLAASEDTNNLRSGRRTAMKQAVLEGICHPKHPPYAAAMAALPDLCRDPAELVFLKIIQNAQQPIRCRALMDALADSSLQLTPLQRDSLTAVKAMLGVPRDNSWAYGAPTSLAGQPGKMEPGRMEPLK